jgi:ubiquinol-cytochrome c reductase iron-sulfur subunit
MDEEKPHAVKRRDFLTIATAAVGLCGIGLSAIPFIEAMGPTKDIIASGVMDVDITGIKEGEFRVVIWRRQPVFILKRTREMIEKTGGIAVGSLSDPATPEERVVRPDFLVCMGICTHLGCIPGWQPDKIPDLDMPGFYCPCHGGKYDSLGRRLAGPPPENLHLLPYRFASDNRLILGAATFAGYSENIRKIQDLPKV